MKRAILKEYDDTIHVDQITTDKIIITQNKLYTYIVTSEKYHNPKYKKICLTDSFTSGNSTGGIYHSLRSLIHNSLRNNHKVFVFDSMKEAIEWLNKNIK
jgi:hypothetical protein